MGPGGSPDLQKPDVNSWRTSSRVGGPNPQKARELLTDHSVPRDD